MSNFNVKCAFCHHVLSYFLRSCVIVAYVRGFLVWGLLLCFALRSCSGLMFIRTTLVSLHFFWKLFFVHLLRFHNPSLDFFLARHVAYTNYRFGILEVVRLRFDHYLLCEFILPDVCNVFIRGRFLQTWS